MTENIKTETGFNPKTYTHVVPPGLDDWNDYTDEDIALWPELDYSDEQVQAEYEKLSPEMKIAFKELVDYCETHYRQYGYIRSPSMNVCLAIAMRYPALPTDTTDEQNYLRWQLLERIRKYERETNPANISPVRKIRRIVPKKLPSEIIDITGADPRKPQIICVQPGADPFEVLNLEEDEHERLVGDVSATEDNPDDLSGDDLSVRTTDSMSKVDKLKVKKALRELGQAKKIEADNYKTLASMVDGMSADYIYDTVQQLPRPSSSVPAQVEAFFTEDVRDERRFREIIALGALMYEKYETHRHRKAGLQYTAMTKDYICKKLAVDGKKIREVERGEAYQRVDNQMEKARKREREEREQQEAAQLMETAGGTGEEHLPVAGPDSSASQPQ